MSDNKIKFDVVGNKVTMLYGNTKLATMKVIFDNKGHAALVVEDSVHYIDTVTIEHTSIID
jgi:hypothetical protein